jgi:polyisoprenyl-phosphate glycosyltransferase
MDICAIIPAYNEVSRVGRVVETVAQSRLVRTVIVVDDGSTDGTAQAVATNHHVQAITLPRNAGKAQAMRTGAEATPAPILLFLDADLIGLTPHHVDALAAPLLEGQADMSLGILCQSRYSTDFAQRWAPGISGQRALPRETFLAIPRLAASRSGVEIRINHYARRHQLRVTRVQLPGVTHVMKEEKVGVVRGLWGRGRMYWEIASAWYDCDGDGR